MSVLVVCAFIGLRVCRVVNKVAGKDYVDTTVTIKPEDKVYGETFQVTGTFRYTLEVTSLDGPLAVALTDIQSKDKPTEPEILKLLRTAEAIAPGKSRTKSGTVRTGNYAWIVINTDDQKAVRAKIKFHATEK